LLPVVWREDAANALDEIIDFIAQFNEAAADRLEAQALAMAERLSDYPHLFRPGRVAGTREAIFHPNYVLIYRVGASEVEIVNVLHTRRQYPPAAED